jgi:hypothetical protein
MMRTPTDDAAWVTRCQAAMERLRLREAAAKAGASAQEVTGPGDAARGLEPAEAVTGDARLEVPGTGGSEPGSIATTQVTIEAAEAETSVHDAGRADVKKLREVAEAPPEVGQEAAQPERNRRGRSRNRSRTGQRSRRSRRNGGWSCHRPSYMRFYCERKTLLDGC